MKCAIPEISWHNREPVLSVALHPLFDSFYRLATGGADCHILIWQLNICDSGGAKLEPLSDLTRHQRAVNSVRWSPSGQYLGSADDDANIIIWQLKTDNIPLLEGETNDKEIWIVYKILRGHKEDIYDICWSTSSLQMISGSVDNTAILWDVTKGKNEHILTDHKGFVQGVSCDPKGHYLATISTDRVCRIFDSSGKHVRARIHKGYLPVPENHYLHNKEVKFFCDDTFKSFFRRLDFSPDGTLLAVPSGHIEVEDCKKTLNATYLFAVDSWKMPISVLPSGNQCSTVIRFCPTLFELHEEGPDAIISLPYRMIFAVGTDHDVILYDTQQSTPFAYFRNIHYTRLTDLTWSHDGLLLVASSTDGFCALITFEPNELGIRYVKEDSETEENPLEISGCEELNDDSKAEAKKKPSLLEKWTIRTPKRSKKEKEVKGKCESGKILDNVNKIVPRRIKPTLVEESKETSVSQANKKTSPLMGFLKKGSRKSSSKKTDVEVAAVIAVNEDEARDAWKCEKENSVQTSIEDTKIEEHTEDFILHLESSVTGMETLEKSTDQMEIKNAETIMETEPKVDGKKCNGSETEEKPEISAIEVKNSVTKRRIPLITLSSPKHKKKEN